MHEIEKGSAPDGAVPSPPGAERNQYLTFSLGGEEYAIDILHIREILEYTRLTPVPMMPSFIAGVLNLRGAVVPVVDLSVRFGGRRSEVGKRTSIVIVEQELEEGLMAVGVIVDTVNQVLDIAADQVEPSPRFGARLRSDFIAGMGKVDDQFLVLLDVRHVLCVDELSIIADIHPALDGVGEGPR